MESSKSYGGGTWITKGKKRRVSQRCIEEDYTPSPPSVSTTSSSSYEDSYDHINQEFRIDEHDAKCTPSPFPRKKVISHTDDAGFPQ